jgi:hypothetical protein
MPLLSVLHQDLVDSGGRLPAVWSVLMAIENQRERFVSRGEMLTQRVSDAVVNQGGHLLTPESTVIQEVSEVASVEQLRYRRQRRKPVSQSGFLIVFCSNFPSLSLGREGRSE